MKTRQIKDALNAADDSVYSSLADNMNELNNLMAQIDENKNEHILNVKDSPVISRL
jgi:hypothetical protein